jgi:hypothetical protein
MFRVARCCGDYARGRMRLPPVTLPGAGGREDRDTGQCGEARECECDCHIITLPRERAVVKKFFPACVPASRGRGPAGRPPATPLYHPRSPAGRGRGRGAPVFKAQLGQAARCIDKRKFLIFYF